MKRSILIGGLTHAAVGAGVHVFYGFFDEFSEDFEIDVFEFCDVEAGFTGFVFAEFFEQGIVVAKSGHDVYGEVGFAGRNAGDEPVAFPAAFVLVMIGAEADDTVAPHFGFVAGNVLHHLDDDFGIFDSFFVFDALQELWNAFFVLLRFELGHATISSRSDRVPLSSKSRIEFNKIDQSTEFKGD